MRMRLEKDLLVNACEIVTKACEKKEENILSNIFVSINESGQLLAMAQDGQILIQHREQSATFDFEPGTILLNQLALDAIRKLPKGEINIELAGDNLNISSGKKINKKVLVKNPEDYPISELEKEVLTTISVTGDELKKFNRVIYAAAVEETRPMLTGVYCEIEDKHLNVFALDGLRIANTNIKISDVKKSDKLNFLLSAKKLQLVINICANAANCMINITNNYVYFITPQSVVAIRLMNEQYVPANQMVSQMSFNKTLKLNKDEFLNALERSKDFSDSKTTLIKFTLSENQMVLRADGSLGKSEEILDCILQINEEFEIAFNNSFCIEALKNSVSEKDITVEFSDSSSPMRIKDANCSAVVLPIRFAK